MTDLKFILLCFTLMVSACGHNRKTVDAVPNTDFEPIGINLPLRQNVSDSLMTSVMGTDYLSLMRIVVYVYLYCLKNWII